MAERGPALTLRGARCYRLALANQRGQFVARRNPIPAVALISAIPMLVVIVLLLKQSAAGRDTRGGNG